MTKTINGDAGTKRFVLIVATIAAFLTPFGISSVNIALPSIGKEFRMDAILLSWVTTVYLLVSASVLIPVGKAADIYGRKRIFTYGILIFTIASLGSGISNSAMMLIFFRILQGIGAAAIYSIATAILTSVFPSSELGNVLGINLAAAYFGYSTGPFLGGFLTHQLGWRSIFFVNVFLGLIIISLLLLKVEREWQEAKDEKIDLTGSIIFSLTILLIIYGFSQVSTMRGVYVVLLGALGMGLFVKWESKVEHPVLNITLFKNNRVFVFSNLAALIHYGATFAVTFLLSLYLQYIKGLTPEKAGLILLPQPVMQAVCSPFTGRLSDRVEPGIVASIGMALTAAGICLFTLLTEETTIAFIVASLILLGFGFALFVPPNTNAVMGSVESRFYGVAAGTLGTMRMMGMALSMGMTILIFSIYIGKVQITPEYYGTFLRTTKLAFTFLAILCFGGVLASLARGNVRHKGRIND